MDGLGSLALLESWYQIGAWRGLGGRNSVINIIDCIHLRLCRCLYFQPLLLHNARLLFVVYLFEGITLFMQGHSNRWCRHTTLVPVVVPL